MALPHSSRQRSLIVKKAAGKDAGKDGAKTERGKRWAYIRQYAGWIRPSWKPLLGLFGLALLAALLDLVWPYFLKMMVDRLGRTDLTSSAKMAWLVGCSVVVLAILPVKQGVELVRAYRTAALNVKLVIRIRRRLFATLIRLPLGKLGDFKSGGVVSRLGSDVDQLSGFVQQALIAPSVAGLRILLTIGVLIYLSWKLALATLIALPPVAVLTYVWLRKVRPLYRSMLDDRNALDARVGETFGGIRVVRAFRRELREARDYAVGTHTVIRKMLRANAVEFMLENGWGLLVPLASLVIVGFGGYLYIYGRGQLGDVFTFQIYAVLLFGPVIQIVSSVSATQRSLAAMERVFDTLAEPLDKPDKAGAVEAPATVEEIRFDHVSFSYREGVEVLRDLELTVRGGTTVALVGPSGAGKTTFTDLVCRFHDPVTGRVTLNGIDLRDMRLRSFRSLLAMVQQETFLFDGTVHENIAYGRRHAARDEVIEAARRANAHEFIGALPEGYDTQVGERGFKLSGGQRQRLSIARAILADPKILVLDEATSNLDTESEQLIQAALAELLKNRTTFVIAHRLSTVTSADQIVVLDAGRIVEVGRHEELLGRRGMYFEMVERQRLGQNVGE
jgi:ATP-binding cassette subfamily B protein/subfamily B ATP-binding cassette protein MsbA